ncbi:hypothetical protein ACJBUE_19455 (plasmid) [Ralstonia syzygii subsp. celebesensis]|uniref:hypothetical protein n=1 Tax=Ralstonia syzygii TaxID=28097 RepID=UPI00387E1824
MQNRQKGKSVSRKREVSNLKAGRWSVGRSGFLRKAGATVIGIEACHRTFKWGSCDAMDRPIDESMSEKLVRKETDVKGAF